MKKVQRSMTMNFLIKDNCLYSNYLTRQGSGSGTNGTWTTSNTNTELYAGFTDVTDEVTTLVITNTTIKATTVDTSYFKGYEASTTDKDTEDLSYTYAPKDSDTITVTDTYDGGVEDWDYFVEGDKLVFTTPSGSQLKKQ